MTYRPDHGDEHPPVPDEPVRSDDAEPVEAVASPATPSEGDAEPVAAAELDSESEGDQEPERGTKRSRPFWIEVPLLIVVALVIAVVIKTFLVQAFFIPSGSMEETLTINDRILVNKLAFRFDDPNRFDVVVFDSGERREESLLEGIRRNVGEAIGLSAPESDFIKRVIALPGEVVEIRDNTVFVDGLALVEPYLKPGTAMADFGPMEVEADHYFMMGDNRNLSSDSRFSGTVARDRLVGRAFVVVWPPSNWDGL